METQTVPGLFAQLAPLLAHRAVLITVSKLDDGEVLQVNICPRQLKDGENQALTMPLSVTGTPRELDAELVIQIAGFVASHVGLNTNLTAVQAEIAEAEKAAREEAKKRQKTIGNVGRKAEPAKPDAVPPAPQQSLGLFDQPPVADAEVVEDNLHETEEL